MFFKRKYDILPATLSGVVISVAGTICIDKSQSEKIYDNPEVKVVNYLDNDALSPLMFITPHTALITSHLETRIGERGGRNSVYGNDVIKFQESPGTYVLNFPADRKFRDAEGTLVSLADEENYIKSLIEKRDLVHSK